MALRTAALVRRYRDAEVIQEVVLAVGLALETGNVRRHTFPGEVRPHQHVGTDQAVAGKAVIRTGVLVLGEITGVQFLDLVSATGDCIAVENVHDAVAVEILLGIALAVTIQVPAGEAVCAVDPADAVHAVSSRCPVVAFATGDRNGEKHTDKKARKMESRARSPSHFQSPQVNSIRTLWCSNTHR